MIHSKHYEDEKKNKLEKNRKVTITPILKFTMLFAKKVTFCFFHIPIIVNISRELEKIFI